jgi:hypothetical protein
MKTALNQQTIALIPCFKSLTQAAKEDGLEQRGIASEKRKVFPTWTRVAS